MTKLTKIFGVTFLLAAMMFTISSMAFASSIDAVENTFSTTEETNSVATRVASDVVAVCYDMAGNQYSGTLWPTLGAAMSYYGYDFTYESCSQNYMGTLYNYCYTFADKTKMFFRVSE